MCLVIKRGNFERTDQSISMANLEYSFGEFGESVFDEFSDHDIREIFQVIYILLYLNRVARSQLCNGDQEDPNRGNGFSRYTVTTPERTY